LFNGITNQDQKSKITGIIRPFVQTACHYFNKISNAFKYFPLTKPVLFAIAYWYDHQNDNRRIRRVNSQEEAFHTTLNLCNSSTKYEQSMIAAPGFEDSEFTRFQELAP
jgi:hypothetical protein